MGLGRLVRVQAQVGVLGVEAVGVEWGVVG